ncbi:sensor histidine kinase [Bacillus sp. HMF5848]|uniref:sensor histidine kinase n=1 Tax=Bacillus sp. HMF5848 TaxID=2495421 RepID=UPI000F76D76D|nr:sensor histidine kinase [Bacillus sp. HMF5848]RSK25864.1 sensor histidine kinase [Bacillus sp. HMF5848]
MKHIRKAMLLGFVFGVFFLLLAYLGHFEIKKQFIWTIPFLVSLLCGLGVIVASFTSKLLASRGIPDGAMNTAISFVAAAIVNILVMLIIMSLSGDFYMQEEVLLFSILGLAGGAAYGAYHFRIERVREKMRFLEELNKKNKQLQEATRVLTITEERNRLSRELHDSVSQGLHGLVYAMHSLRHELTQPSDRTTAILSHMEATAQATLSELRTMIQELKPSLLAEQGLEESIRVTVHLFSQRMEIPVEIDYNLPQQVLPEVELTIYRVTQEAFANIERHSQAKHVQLKISDEKDQVLLTISDDGKGFAKMSSSHGNGLRNMRQRVEEVGGTFDIVSKPYVGTTLIAKFPSKG